MPPSRTWKACGAGVATAALAWSPPALAVSPPTIYDNYQMFPVGSRAAGMGGAYTALGCDEAALHYNPAALACASASHLELAANAYVIEGARVPSALGPGEDIRATSYHSLPSIVGAVRILRDGDAETGAGRVAFGLTVAAPQSLALQVNPSNPAKQDFFALSVRDDITTGDLGLGYQITEALAVGLSVGAVLRTSEMHSNLLLVRERAAPCGVAVPGGQRPGCNDFVFVNTDQQLLAVGARAKLGVRYRPAPGLTLGLTLTAPTLNVYGSASINTTQMAARSDGPAGTPSYGAIPVRLTGSSDVSFPFRAAAGVAYAAPRFTISLDLSVNLPREVRTAHDLTAQPVAGIPVPTGAALADSVISPGVQPNANLGVELAVGRDKVLDLGAFTDLSSVSQQDMAAHSADRTHMFGGSLALGLLGKQSRGWFGLSFEGGATSTQVPGTSFTLDRYLQSGVTYGEQSTLTRWTLAGIVGSNYSFLPED